MNLNTNIVALDKLSEQTFFGQTLWPSCKRWFNIQVNQQRTSSTTPFIIFRPLEVPIALNEQHWMLIVLDRLPIYFMCKFTSPDTNFHAIWKAVLHPYFIQSTECTLCWWPALTVLATPLKAQNQIMQS